VAVLGGYCRGDRACGGLRCRKGAVTDPQPEHVGEAERLLEQADRDGVAPLPVLTAAELWVLCNADQVLADEAELRWWSRKTDEQRQAMATSIPDLLAERNLIADADKDALGGRAHLTMTPGLAMIVAARQRPPVVAIGIRADGSVSGTPRMFGLAWGGQTLRAVVGEYIGQALSRPYGPVLGPEHKFSLLSVARAGHVLAVWAATSGTQMGIRGRLNRAQGGKTRVIDISRHQAAQLLSRARVSVTGASEPFAVSRLRAGTAPEPAVRCTRDELARLLTQSLTEASQ
jgi:hypothetical protein